MQDELGDRDDVQILAFNTGDDTSDVVETYFEKEGFTFDAVMDVDGKARANARSLGLAASPTNIVVDRDGRVMYASVGFDEAQVRTYLGL